MVKSKQDGKKAGGGRPSSWQHQPTGSLRVPVEFHSLLLELARKLDEGWTDPIIVQPEKRTVNRQSKKDQVSLSSLRVYRHAGHKAVRIQELIDALKRIVSED